MRYSIVGIFGLMTLVALAAAFARAYGIHVLAVVIHASVPTLLWCMLLSIKSQSVEQRLTILRRGLLAFLFVFLVGPIVDEVARQHFAYDLVVAFFFWGVQYLAIVSWVE
ncbi:MAG: hypothetical protein VB878_02170 [Pirellulaceae bacterium]